MSESSFIDRQGLVKQHGMSRQRVQIMCVSLNRKRIWFYFGWGSEHSLQLPCENALLHVCNGCNDVTIFPASTSFGPIMPTCVPSKVANDNNNQCTLP